jgi:hypothetical protein
VDVARDLGSRRPCSSTADATVITISLTDGIVAAISFIAPTDCAVAFWMAAICCPISSVAFAVWLASDFTYNATTAKLLPASPAPADG